jgi:hypoxanthine phosphoribosyltransferase
MDAWALQRPRVLFSEEQLRVRIAELGAQIAKDYRNLEAPLILVGVLKGATIFLADLCRAIDLPVEIEFMGVSSYGDATQSSGLVRVTHDLKTPVEGRHVMFVEDIVDTGLSASFLLDYLRARRPATLRFCSLLEKPDRKRVAVPLDYVGFVIPDLFVVGFGLDYNERYRNLPYIGVLESP